MFAACKLNFWVFVAAALVSTPKLLIPVIVGNKLEEANATTSKRSFNVVQFCLFNASPLLLPPYRC